MKDLGNAANVAAELQAKVDANVKTSKVDANVKTSNVVETPKVKKVSVTEKILEIIAKAEYLSDTQKLQLNGEIVPFVAKITRPSTRSYILNEITAAGAEGVTKNSIIRKMLLEDENIDLANAANKVNSILNITFLKKEGWPVRMSEKGVFTIIEKK